MCSSDLIKIEKVIFEKFNSMKPTDLNLIPIFIAIYELMNDYS